MKKRPMVSVIMSVYNAESYVKNAVDSILCQTFCNFEFLVIDDASTDHTLEILREYSDDRLKIFSNEENVGLTKNLNKLLCYSQGIYIARIDADDISYHKRLELQVQFLETHADVYLISCSYREIGDRFNKNQIKMQEKQIKSQFIFGSVLPHPGFMFRRELFSQYGIRYDPDIKYAQDYDFQVRVSNQFHIACLPQILLYYRISPGQVSTKKTKRQRLYANRIRYQVLKRYGVSCSEKQVEVMSRLYYGEKITSFNEYIDLIKLYWNMRHILHNKSYIDWKYINATMLGYIRQL